MIPFGRLLSLHTRAATFGESDPGGPHAAPNSGPQKLSPLPPTNRARIVYYLLTSHEPYDESIYAKHQQQSRARATAKLKAQAISLGFQLIPIPTAQTPAEP